MDVGRPDWKYLYLLDVCFSPLTEMSPVVCGFKTSGDFLILSHYVTDSEARPLIG